MSTDPQMTAEPEKTIEPQLTTEPNSTHEAGEAAVPGLPTEPPKKASIFTANLKKLPGVSHLAALNLLDGDGNVAASIENKAGSQGSLAVYNHLGLVYGAITAEAARKGLELYAEHTEDALAHPGKHPNIDRLLEIADGRRPTLRVKHVFAV